MNHLSAEQLSATLDGALGGAERAAAERHLAECARCREALAELAAQEDALRPALEHDPGDDYFETFAARVEDRIRAEGLTGAQSRLGAGGAFGWLRSPRRLAWVGAVVTVVAGAGIVILSSREVQRPLIPSAVVQRAERDAGAAAPAPEMGQAAPTRTQADDRDAAAQKKERFAEEGLEARDQLEPKLEVQAGRADEAAPAPALAREAAPKRLVEVRRNASGEDVPVGSPYNFAQPPAPEAAAGGDLKSAKPRAAAPLEAAPTQDAMAKSLAPSTAEGETRLCGQVMDPSGRPVAGAVVALADRGRTATADREGRFCISAPVGFHQLTAMAVGYETSHLEVRVEGESATTMVTLKPVSVLDQKALTLGGRGGAVETSEAGIGGAMKSLYRQEAEAASPATREAERLSARAESLGTAPAFDAAAAAWERVVRASRDSARLEARFRLAEARFRAWQAAPTAVRLRAARTALDAFLAAAPSGPRREQVAGWRDRLR